MTIPRPTVNKPRDLKKLSPEQRKFWEYVDSIQPDEHGVKIMDLEKVRKQCGISARHVVRMANIAGYSVYMTKDRYAYREVGTCEQ